MLWSLVALVVVLQLADPVEQEVLRVGVALEGITVERIRLPEMVAEEEASPVYSSLR